MSLFQSLQLSTVSSLTFISLTSSSTQRFHVSFGLHLARSHAFHLHFQGSTKYMVSLPPPHMTALPQSTPPQQFCYIPHPTSRFTSRVGSLSSLHTCHVSQHPSIIITYLLHCGCLCLWFIWCRQSHTSTIHPALPCSWAEILVEGKICFCVSVYD